MNLVEKLQILDRLQRELNFQTQEKLYATLTDDLISELETQIQIEQGVTMAFATFRGLSQPYQVRNLIDKAGWRMAMEHQKELQLHTLKDGRARVEAGWTQGVDARSADGEEVNLKMPEATCFCALGAVFRVAPLNIIAHQTAKWLDKAVPEEADLSQAVDKGLPKAAQYNDLPTTTKENVLALYDRAIALREAQV